MNMLLTLNRKWFTPESTIGELLVDGRFNFFTLEDVVRPEGEPKVYGRTAIPSGKYPIVLDYSPKYCKLMPHVIGVPGFTGIRLHSGNIAEHTEGCILIGKEREPNKILRSREAFQELFALMKAEWDNNGVVSIEINNCR